MRKLFVAAALILCTLSLAIAFLLVDGQAREWATPIALLHPAVIMAVVCFDQRLAIGHYVLTVIVATLGIYWIALGVAGYAAIQLTYTPTHAAICATLGSSPPAWPGYDPNALAMPLTFLISVFFVVFGFIWLLPTRRVWDAQRK